MNEAWKILDRIPSKGLQACLVLTFSLDINYIERVFQPEIARKGIYNLQILADQDMVHQVLEQQVGHEHTYGSNYALLPVGARRGGAFHPKILLFFGQNIAILLIGSGNLTFGGHGQNHELWTKFVAEDQADPAFSIIAAAISYLKKMAETASQVVINQIGEAIAICPLFVDIPSQISRSTTFPNGLQASFVSNDFASGSIFDSITTSIPQEEVKTIRILAPFYDQEGAAIAALATAFPLASIEVYLQVDAGAHPYAMKFNQRIQFFDFHKAFPNAKRRNLHAKIFEFESRDHAWILLGSPNASVAALGLPSVVPVNEEAGILFRRSEGWLASLGRVGLDTQLRIQDLLKPSKDPIPEVEVKKAFLGKITSLEIRGIRMTFTCECKPSKELIFLSLFDLHGKLFFSQPISAEHDSSQLLELSQEIMLQKCAFGCITDKSENLRSRRFPVFYLDDLSRKSPSAANRTMGEFYSSLGDYEIPIIPIILFWDKQATIKKQSNSKNPHKEGTPEEVNALEYRVLTYEEFHSKLNSAPDHKKGEIQRQHASAEFLGLVRIYAKEMEEVQEGIAAAKEEEPLEKADASKVVTKKKEITITRSKFNEVRTKVFSHFQTYLQQLDKFIGDRKEFNLTDIQLAASNLISIHVLRDRKARLQKDSEKQRIKEEKRIQEIMNRVVNEKATTDEESDTSGFEESQIVEAQYGQPIWLPTYGRPENPDHFRALALGILGKFLRYSHDARPFNHRQDMLLDARFREERYRLTRIILLTICALSQLKPSPKLAMNQLLRCIYFNTRLELVTDQDFDPVKEVGIFDEIPLPAEFNLELAMEFLSDLEDTYQKSGSNYSPSFHNQELSYFEDFGFCYIAKTAPANSQNPASVIFGHPSFPYSIEDNDYTYDRWYQIKKGAFMQGVSRI